MACRERDESKPTGRKRTFDELKLHPRKRSRSVSSYSSDSDSESVSTISTNRPRSRSGSPSSGRRSDSRDTKHDQARPRKVSNARGELSSLADSRDRRDVDERRDREIGASPRKLRRRSQSNNSDRSRYRDGSGRRRARDRSHSPPRESPRRVSRRSRSRSPYRDRQSGVDVGLSANERDSSNYHGRTRQRSLSPYSKRVAMT